jgi:hypothetical protein
MVTLNQALDTVLQLTPEQQEMLVQILWRCQQIAQDAQTSLQAFYSGELHPMSAGLVIAELRQDLSSDIDEDVCVLLDIGSHDEVY